MEKMSQLLTFSFNAVLLSLFGMLSDWLNRRVGNDFESVPSLWLSNKRHMVCNIISFAVMWILWKLCNSLCFQGVPWSGMKMVFAMTGRMLIGWLPMLKLDVQEKVEQVILLMEIEASSPPLIQWRLDSLGSAPSSVQHSEGSSNVVNQCNRA
jgi:hypothetical protein